MRAGVGTRASAAQAEVCCIPACLPSRTGRAGGGSPCFWPVEYGRVWANRGLAPGYPHLPSLFPMNPLPTHKPGGVPNPGAGDSPNPFGSMALGVAPGPQPSSGPFFFFFFFALSLPLIPQGAVPSPLPLPSPPAHLPVGRMGRGHRRAVSPAGSPRKRAH